MQQQIQQILLASGQKNEGLENTNKTISYSNVTTVQNEQKNEKIKQQPTPVFLNDFDREVRNKIIFKNMAIRV
jgi:oligoendopeptidase F